MKKIFILIFTIFIMQFISKAQPPPCPDDCPDVPWQMFTLAFPCEVCPGLFATCNYEWRFNTCKQPNVCEFRIVGQISFTGNIAPSCSMELIIRQLEHCIMDSEIGPEPCGQDMSMVEFYAASCWKWAGPLPGPNGGDMPNMITCSGSGCCQSNWIITQIIYNGQVVGYNIRYISSTPIGPINCNPADPACRYICIE